MLSRERASHDLEERAIVGCSGRPRRRSGIRPKTNMEVKRHRELRGPTSRCRAASSRLLRVGLRSDGRRAGADARTMMRPAGLRGNSTSLEGEGGAEGWMNGCQEAPAGLWMTTSPFQDSPPRPPPARRRPFASRSPTCPDVRPGPGGPPATLPAALPPARARRPRAAAARLPRGGPARAGAAFQRGRKDGRPRGERARPGTLASGPGTASVRSAARASSPGRGRLGAPGLRAEADGGRGRARHHEGENGGRAGAPAAAVLTRAGQCG